ncbi:MAG TPA: transcription antitermination factor NusB, partial [Kiloniellales bacterium]
MTTPAATSASKDRASGQRRSAARLAAVQALYQIELSGTAPEVVLNEFLDHRLKEEVDGLRLDGADRRMLSDLVAGIAKEAHALDDMLSAVLE